MDPNAVIIRCILGAFWVLRDRWGQTRVLDGGLDWVKLGGVALVAWLGSGQFPGLGLLEAVGSSQIVR